MQLADGKNMLWIFAAQVANLLAGVNEARDKLNTAKEAFDKQKETAAGDESKMDTSTAIQAGLENF